MACHSSSWNDIVQSNSVWQQASMLYGQTFLIGCVLCLLLLLAEFFDLQFGLWFCLDLIFLNKGHIMCKHVP